MEEEYIVYVIYNTLTKEYYSGVIGANETFSKWEYKYCKLLKDAFYWDNRKDANEYIREWLYVKELIVKKVTIGYRRS
jgi:hypothetical protein